ncbi:patatin-like phospholipase family protein [Actinomadura barringtoniae]|uniref:Patatin-like phospholipase family protein n=1 Tax=Actinomadura barringtoniae TaxID=1427535 RepID=A0A939PMX9_9ACTN|nr:patatin-like phospholipase family protein [Actinomadura barringtoniae]MBO2455008.1 patatin-like phospholipase family protein [Actinomadura barringtoniae]
MGKALVLGGGGLTGIGWEWGILSGLAAHGVDLTDADLVIGTSAGSVVGAQVATGVDLEERFASQLAAPIGDPRDPPARMGRADLARSAWAVLSTREPDRLGARLGRLALASRTPHRSTIRAHLPVREWPVTPLLITAVDAASGELTVFDRDHGVSLLDAVGASCAVPGVYPPVAVDGRSYIDGGVRSATNADLARGHERVVIIAPIAAGFGAIRPVASQAEALRETGSRVLVISPPTRFGRSLDPTRRAPAARAGRAQAAALAESAAVVWSAP